MCTAAHPGLATSPPFPAQELQRILLRPPERSLSTGISARLVASALTEVTEVVIRIWNHPQRCHQTWLTGNSPVFMEVLMDT